MTTESKPSQPSAAFKSDARSVGDDSPLADLLSLLVRRRSLLFATTIIGGLISAALAFWLTPLYAATAVIMPPPKAQSLSSAMMGQLGAMAGSLSPALGLKDPADLHIGILKSRTVNDSIVVRFNLVQVYSVKTRTDAVKKLASRASFTAGKDSLIRISVEDADPKRAADIANAYVAELHTQNNRLALTESAQRRLFFERALQKERQVLAEAEERLKLTQTKTGVVEIASQAEGVVRSIAQLQAEIAGREVQLQRLRLSATPQNPDVARQETELAALRAQLAKLESGGTKSRSGDPLIPFSKVPQAGLDSVRVLRDVKYHESLFEVLAKQYEAAQIDEAKESQEIQIVDVAIPPEKKSWPPRLMLTILGSITSAILGCTYLFLSSSSARLVAVLRRSA